MDNSNSLTQEAMTPFQKEWLQMMAQQNALLAQQNGLIADQNKLFNRLGLTIGQMNSVIDFIAMAMVSRTVCRFAYPLESWNNFNWQEIGAEVMSVDRKGYPSQIKWRSNIYQVRSNSRNGMDVWYSRLLGTTEGGKHIYDVLVKFSENYGKTTIVPEEIREKAGII